MHLVNSRFLVSVPMFSKWVLQHVCQHPFVLFRMTLSCHSSHLSQMSKINLGITVVKYQRRLIVNEGEKRSKAWINFNRWRDFYCFSFLGKFVLTKRYEMRFGICRSIFWRWQPNVWWILDVMSWIIHFWPQSQKESVQKYEEISDKER